MMFLLLANETEHLSEKSIDNCSKSISKLSRKPPAVSSENLEIASKLSSVSLLLGQENQQLSRVNTIKGRNIV